MADQRVGAQLHLHRPRWPEVALTSALGLTLGLSLIGPYHWPLGLAAAGGLAELPFGFLGVLAAAAAGLFSGGSEAGFAALLTLALLPVALSVRLIPGAHRGVSGMIGAFALSLPLALGSPGGGLHWLLPPICLALSATLWFALQAMRSPHGERRRIGAAVLALWLVWALKDMAAYGLSLSLTAALALCFLAVRLRLAAAPFAALTGLLLALTGAAPAGIALGVAAGGTVGQALRRFGSFWGWIGFALGLALPAGGIPQHLGEQIVALLLVLLGASQGLPDRYYLKLRAYLSPPPPPAPAGPSERLEEAAHQLDELVRGLGAEAVVPSVGEEADVARALGGVRERVCAGCPQEHVCWNHGFYRTYTGVRELMLRQDGAPASGRDLPGELRQRCPRPDQVATAVSLAGDQLRAEANVRRLLHAERALSRDALIGVRQMLSWAISQPEPPLPARLSFASGLARVAKGRERVSGDSYLVRELSGARLLIALSDGMGAGYPAAEQSGSALEAVEGFLAAGMDPLIAVRAANAARRGGAGERYATMDLAVADLAAGELSLLKIGAPETYLRQDGEVHVLRGEGLPLGMVAEAQPTVQNLTLRPGDVLVLVSDGVLEGPPGPRGLWLESLLDALPNQDPQYLAEAILDAALGRRGVPRDDVTVLVTAFLSASREPEVRAWVRRDPAPAGIAGARPGQAGTGRRRRSWARRSTDR